MSALFDLPVGRELTAQQLLTALDLLGCELRVESGQALVLYAPTGLPDEARRAIANAFARYSNVVLGFVTRGAGSAPGVLQTRSLRGLLPIAEFPLPDGVGR